MSDDDISNERGSGNAFADLGRPDAEAHLLKAELSAGLTWTAPPEVVRSWI
jgi:hypothetical protein